MPPAYDTSGLLIRSNSSRCMSTTAPDLLLELDRSSRRGLRSQIEGGLRDAISAGRLAPGTSLPSSRALAADLGVTRGVVVAAYDQLLAEGYLLARQGAGTDRQLRPGQHRPRLGADEPALVGGHRLPPERSRARHLPAAAWLRATRTALQTLPDSYLGYSDPRGLRRLRSAVAEYLGRVRGVVADTDQVVICNGFSHGLSLVARQLLDAGLTTIAVEDPGHHGPRSELDWLGIGHHPVPVDGDGIDVDDLRRSPARAAIVTPAHQFPSGVVLSPLRRRALIAWARAVDGYVIEDDYDAEYRYDRHPVGAMQGLAPDRVIYSGTLSKSLAAGSASRLARAAAATRRADRRQPAAHRPLDIDHRAGHLRRVPRQRRPRPPPAADAAHLPTTA